MELFQHPRWMPIVSAEVVRRCRWHLPCKRLTLISHVLIHCHGEAGLSFCEGCGAENVKKPGKPFYCIVKLFGN